MTDSHTTPEAAILVAVDIAKDHNEVLIELRERRDRHRRFRVPTRWRSTSGWSPTCASSMRPR
jgi:hypothetical protein